MKLLNNDVALDRFCGVIDTSRRRRRSGECQAPDVSQKHENVIFNSISTLAVRISARQNPWIHYPDKMPRE